MESHKKNLLYHSIFKQKNRFKNHFLHLDKAMDFNQTIFHCSYAHCFHYRIG